MRTSYHLIMRLVCLTLNPWPVPLFDKGVMVVAFFLCQLTMAQLNGLVAVSKPPVPVLATDPAQGLVFKLSSSLTSAAPFFDTKGGPVSLEYIAFYNGDAFITFDDGPSEMARGGVMVLTDFMEREGERFDPTRDYLITGTETGLLEPKDLAVVAERNVIIVADFAGKDIRVFDLATRGDAAPRFIATVLEHTEDSIWGLAFDASQGRLFVGATDGTVLVYDNFLETQGQNGPDRVITPVINGHKASANFHELIYLPEKDTLIVVDVGRITATNETGFDMDGMIWMLENASSADGDISPKARLAGPNTLLGNPVALTFDGTSLYVAEKAKSLVLRFENVLELNGDVNVAPHGAVTIIEPESIVLSPPN
jgi:hypothetical protein